MLKVKLGVIFALLISINFTQAQDEQKKWAIGFGVNSVDFNKGGFNDFGDMLKDYMGTSDWNVVPTISTLSGSRYLNYGLSVKLSVSFNEIDKVVAGNIDGFSFFALDAAALYDLNHLFGQTGWWDPYVSFGFGSAWVDGYTGVTITPGYGFNTWFNDRLGLSVSSAYNSSAYTGGNFESANATSYFQHSLGLIYKFGDSKQDTDGDDVADEKDLCPDAAGTKENGGCPDTDGDLVLDKNDLCPNASGTKENGGCPDTDGDLVLDKVDLCPNSIGTAQNGGCPDADNDGVIDADDLCPKVAGPIENKGCIWPDTDGDSVADKDDKCPEIAGTIKKRGCPELTELQIKKLGEFSKKIGFNSGKATFKLGTTDKLDGLAKVMLEYPTTSFVINGYTDSVGSEIKNLEISKRRAKAVKDYLVSQGVEESRLKSDGFGIKNPIATNKTSKGRALNRRVEIIAQ